ncbi:MAG: hypothetical protein EPO21_07290 [Chloroflexota bacterium]|nr:MAG: hypothetical protein EPO21_07290 [Chloroflexota bacterium]
MPKGLKHIDISQKGELLRIAEQVRSAKQPLVLSKGGEDVAVLRPLKRAARKPHSKGRPTSADDPFWSIIGMAAGPDDGVTDVSGNKHKYLSDAYDSTHK